LLYKADDVNVFGYYDIVSIEPYVDDNNFYVVTLSFIEGNGSIEEDMDYMISMIDINTAEAQDLQSVTDIGSITTNTITAEAFIKHDGDGTNLLLDDGTTIPLADVGSQSLQDVTDIGNTTDHTIIIDSTNYYSSLGPDAIGTENKDTGTYAYIGQDGLLGFRNELSQDSQLKNTDVTNNGVILEFPDKATGSYTIATTDDVPTTPGLQQVTDEGAITTNSITADKLIKDGGTLREFLMADGSVTIGNGGVYSYEIHVSQVDGNDTTGTGAVLNPVASITKALTLITGQRRTIIIHPGNYTESPSITSQYTVLTTYQATGGNTLITGTVTTSTGCSVSGLKMTNLTINAPTGTGNVNILNCDISGTLTRTNTGTYTLIRFCDIGVTNINSTSGTVAIFGGNPSFITVNNAGASVLVKNAVCISPVVLIGSATFADCILISTGPTTNALTTSAGTNIVLANSQCVIPTFQNVARISLSGFYSILNCVYDKPNSTLVATSETGGTTNSIGYSQYINADKFIKQGGTGTNILLDDGNTIALSSSATGLTYTNTTGVFSLTSGYSIPTNTSQTSWNTAYTSRIATFSVTGNSGAATFTGNTLNIPEYTLSGLGGVGLASPNDFTSWNTFTNNQDDDAVVTISNSLLGGGLSISAGTGTSAYIAYGTAGGSVGIQLNGSSSGNGNPLLVYDGSNIVSQISSSGVITGSQLKVSGGFTTGFLKANGDIDSTTYSPSPTTITSSTTNLISGSTHTHQITASLGLIGNGSAQYQVPVTGATPFTPTWTSSSNIYGSAGLNSLSFAGQTGFVKMTTANTFALDPITNYAPISSPTFTGTPSLTTTPTAGDNTTKLASTAFVKTAVDTGVVSNITITTSGVGTITTETLSTIGSYSQNGRNVMIDNAAVFLNIDVTTTTPANFIASYTKLGIASILFRAGAGTTLNGFPSGNALFAFIGAPGSTALLTRTGDTFYVQINNLV
jgi:hypothetical protein